MDVTSQVGIDDLSACYADDTGLVFVPYEGYQFVAFSTDDLTVKDLFEGDLDIYLYRDNQVVGTFSDLFVTDSQRVILASSISRDIPSYLKSPSTASFPGTILDLDQYSVTREGDSWTVTSYVDSQNSFGAMVRASFTATYFWDGDINTLPVFSGVEFQE